MFISPTLYVAAIDEKIIARIGPRYEVGNPISLQPSNLLLPEMTMPCERKKLRRIMIINKNEKEWPKVIMMNYPLLCLIQFGTFVIIYAILLLMKVKHKENFHSIQFASKV